MSHPRRSSTTPAVAGPTAPTDTDFGTTLALTGAAGPNVVRLRGVGDSVSERVAAVLEVVPRGRQQYYLYVEDSEPAP